MHTRHTESGYGSGLLVDGVASLGDDFRLSRQTCLPLRAKVFRDPISVPVIDCSLSVDVARPIGLRGRLFIGAADATVAAPTVERFVVEDLGEAEYRVMRPIPVEIERLGVGEYQARFLEANVAIGGTDVQDAYQALVADILDTFDLLTENDNLGRSLVEQREVLQSYIART